MDVLLLAFAAADVLLLASAAADVLLLASAAALAGLTLSTFVQFTGEGS